MKKSNGLLLVLIILGCVKVFSQEIKFEQLPSSDPPVIADFYDVSHAATEFADVDNDGDLDLLIIGEHTGSHDRVAILYINDGVGNYIKKDNTPFVALSEGGIGFADIDGDNDLDVLISGYYYNKAELDYEEETTKLYTNDGDGNFTEVLNTPFTQLGKGEVIFFDADGDGDQDVLLTGKGASTEESFYLNDGNGNFTEHDAGLPKSASGAVSVADIDSDGDLDLFMTGLYLESSSAVFGRYYKNDGNAVFDHIYQTTTPESNPAYEGSAHFFDADNDGDMDLLSAGDAGAFIYTGLYLNDGEGDYDEVPLSETPFKFLSNCVLGINDVDGDGDQDVLFSGYSERDNENFIKLYLNNGSGKFSEKIGTTPFVPVKDGTISFADVDNDNDDDVLITGSSSTILYINKGYGTFVQATGSPFVGLKEGSVDFADVNDDKDIDILVTGSNNDDEAQTALYINNGNGQFSEKLNAPFDIEKGNADFGDIDGDGDMDIIMMGEEDYNDSNVKLYENTGSGNYSEKDNVPFDSLYFCDVIFADLDGDTDLDIVASGTVRTGKYSISSQTNVYFNDGTGEYSVTDKNLFERGTGGAMNVSDVDNDGDLDFMVVGNYKSVAYYINDGNGLFSQVTGSPLDNVKLNVANITFADIDNDGDEDLLIGGMASGSKPKMYLFKNEGNGEFVKVLNTPFTPLIRGSSVFFDMDNDNDQDLLTFGRAEGDKSKTILYENDGTGSFTQISNCNILGLENGDIDVADIDNDGFLDVMMSGHEETGKIVTKLYLNKSNGGSPIDEVTDSQTVCDELVWIDGNTYTEDNNTASVTLKNEKGQDSIVYLDLVVNYSTNSIDQVSACENHTWIDGNYYSESNHSAEYILTNSLGCDSVVSLNLTVHDPIVNEIDVDACGTYTWDGVDYTESGEYTREFIASNGCDSTVIMSLSIHTNTGTDVIASSEPIVWIDGVTYSESNTTATYTLKNSNGCDSVVTLNLTIHEGVLNEIDVEACLPYIWDGVEYSESGEYSRVFTASNGSDSTVVISLSSLNNTGVDVIETVEPIVWIDGVTYSESNYSATFTLENTHGCDSVVTLNLTVDKEIVSIDPKLTSNAMQVKSDTETGSITITFKDHVSATIRVYNINGQTVFQRNHFYGNVFNFTLNVKTGIYYLEVNSDSVSKHTPIYIR